MEKIIMVEVEEDPDDNTSDGLEPPLLIKFTVAFVTLWAVVGNYQQLKEVLYYTWIGLIEILFE